VINTQAAAGHAAGSPFQLMMHKQQVNDLLVAQRTIKCNQQEITMLAAQRTMRPCNKQEITMLAAHAIVLEALPSYAWGWPHTGGSRCSGMLPIKCLNASADAASTSSVQQH
jgi:hypothetical protein